jgi:hypothetical protein
MQKLFGMGNGTGCQSPTVQWVKVSLRFTRFQRSFNYELCCDI